MNRQASLLIVAEDDPDDRFLLEEAFQAGEPQYQLQFAEHGEQLLEMLRHPQTKLPGAIVLDLNMPRKDGRAVLAELAQEPRLAAIPVVILTTSRAQDDQVLATRYGCCAFLTKPSSFRELVNLSHIIVACCKVSE